MDSIELLKAYLIEEIAAGRHRGISLGIFNDGNCRYVNFGKSNGLPISEKRYFEIASVSKIFTSLLILLLAEEKCFALEEPIEKYVPEFKEKNKVRILDLLTHTSGLEGEPQSFKSIAPLNSFIGYTDRQLIEDIHSIEINASKIGTFSYSNFGYLILGLLAKKVGSENSFPALLHKIVLGPLGLTETKFALSELETSTICYGHSEDLSPVTPYLDLGETYASAGALISTTSEMLKVCCLFMNPDKFDGSMRAAIKKLFTTFKDRSGKLLSNGFHVRETNNDIVFYHPGHIAGHKCCILISPERKKAVAYNTDTLNHVRTIWDFFNGP
jgi:CubicO group peptidase (beta-lactamase class C family)